MTYTNESDAVLWLSQASYEDLLRLWRYEPAGSPWFVGIVGNTFSEAMKLARRTVTPEEAATISKRIGWDHYSAPRGAYDQPRS